MKKILLATTILSMSAGFAAADVAVSGSARMGVVSSDSATTFSSRTRINFNGSGTTDAGLAFGASIRADNATEANATGNAGSVFISGAFGKIAMGDVDSGDAAAVGQLASVGYTGLNSTNSINYAADGFDMFGLFKSGTDSYGAPGTVGVTGTTGTLDEYAYDYVGGAAAKVLYTYSAGGLTVDASASQISNGPADHNSYGVGVAYTTGDLTVAAGYGSNEFNFTETHTTSVWVFDGNNHATIADNSVTTSPSYVTESGDVTDATVAVTYAMGDTKLKAIYQDKEISISYEGEDSSASAISMGASVQHTVGALTLTAFGVTTDLTGDAPEVSFTRTGIGASYDLGGGASLAAGAVNVEDAKNTSYSAYDVGVNFSF